jgi:hypothetical protein
VTTNSNLREGQLLAESIPAFANASIPLGREGFRWVFITNVASRPAALYQYQRPHTGNVAMSVYIIHKAPRPLCALWVYVIVISFSNQKGWQVRRMWGGCWEEGQSKTKED